MNTMDMLTIAAIITALSNLGSLVLDMIDSRKNRNREL